MNFRTLIAAVFATTATLAATGAMAQSVPAETMLDPFAVASTLSRAEVRAELLRHRAANPLPAGDATPDFALPVAGMAKTRGQVVAELAEARRLGLVADGERSVFPTAAQLQAIEQAGQRALAMQVAVR